MEIRPDSDVWTKNVAGRHGETVRAVWHAVDQRWEAVGGYEVVADRQQAVDGVQTEQLILVSGRHALIVPWSIIVR